MRNFTAHGSQLAAIAVRPLVSEFTGTTWVGLPKPTVSILPPNNPVKQEEMQPAITNTEPATNGTATKKDEDAESDGSFDPLFDDEPELDSAGIASAQPALPGTAPPAPTLPKPQKAAPAPKNAPPILDSSTYAGFSPDILMTASIDGQVILWDRRAYTLGKGVGRLWMGEKTPPWCMSVCDP